MHILLKTDGGSRGNPGPAGYGYVVRDLIAGIILRKCGNYCGITTNNQAEYLGLISGLNWLSSQSPRPTKLSIVMDSLLIVNQVRGLYKVKEPGLRARWGEVMSILSKFPSWEISHAYRSDNVEADELVNLAIDKRSEVVVI